MTKLISIFCALFISVSAFAMKPDFSAFDHDGGNGGDKMRTCMKDAWYSADPSEVQNQQAHYFMMGVKAVYEANKEGIMQGMHSMMAAWKKHPVSKDEVVAAEGGLKEHLTPVTEALRDGHINVINLLSIDQRAAFDEAFKACMENGK